VRSTPAYAQVDEPTFWTTSMLQCFVAMSWLNLSGVRQTQANVQHAGNPYGYWVLCTPAKKSRHRLKVSAGIRNPMFYPTELQAHGSSFQYCNRQKSTMSSSTRAASRYAPALNGIRLVNQFQHADEDCQMSGVCSSRTRRSTAALASCT